MNALVLILALSLDTVVADAERAGADGVLLVRRGDAIVYERAWGDATPRHRFDIGSITKIMTAAAVLHALPPDLRVGDVCPDAPPDKASITVMQLLKHESGLVDSIGLDETLITRPFFLEKLFKTTLGTPGYSNAGYGLLAAMLEVRTGMPYDVYLRKHLFEPVGVAIGYDRRPPLASGTLRGKAWGSTADYFGPDGRPGWFLLGAGGLIASARDLDRWFAALWCGKLLDAARTKQMRDALTRRDRSGRTILLSSGANTIFSSHYEWWPEEDVTFILLTSDSEWPKEKLLPRLRPAIIELAGSR